MTDILAEIAAYKREVEIPKLPEIDGDLPVAQRDFAAAISQVADTPNLIAEIKPASPVKGRILPESADIGSIARQYESGGVAAISVLTDKKYFQGGFENLRIARKNTNHVPLLCKDFIVSPKQIRHARAYGADSFLLIAKIMEVNEIQHLLDEGRKYNMEALVEIADKDDLAKILQTDSKLIGINNRDLRDFSVDLQHTFLLGKQLGQGTTVVSLSGFSGADVRLVKGVATSVLVGTNIGKAGDISAALKSFTEPKPLIKLCGVRTMVAARIAERADIDLLGLNFVPSSKRCVSDSVAEQIVQTVKHKHLVGVFQDQTPDYVQNICSKFNLTFAQLSGSESAADFADLSFPIIKGVSVSDGGNHAQRVAEWESAAALFLFDGKTPGAGKTFPHHRLPPTKLPFFVAGGVNPENAVSILQSTNADGIDTASGIENETGDWSAEKIERMISSTK